MEVPIIPDLVEEFQIFIIMLKLGRVYFKIFCDSKFFLPIVLVIKGVNTIFFQRPIIPRIGIYSDKEDQEDKYSSLHVWTNRFLYTCLSGVNMFLL